MSLQAVETLNSTTHDLTKVSRENRKIERKLEKQLNGIVNLIRKIHSTTNAKTTMQIQGLLGSEVLEILRSNIQQSYQLGVAYVSQLLRREPFMSTNDIFVCDSMVHDYKNRFWGRIGIYLQGLDPENTRVHSPALVTSISLDIATKALNAATTFKTKELVGNRPPTQGKIKRILNPSPLAEAGIKQIEERIFEDNPGVFESGEFGFQKIMLVWVISQDDQVCPQCQELEGTEWDTNDFDIPTPGHESTHWNCRCRLMLAERELE
jgi:hypothetical protein